MRNKNLKITCLNFNRYKNKEIQSSEDLKKYVIKYLNKKNADIIAGQEFPAKISNGFKSGEAFFEGETKGGSHFFTGFCIKNEEYNTGLNPYAEIEEIWEELFQICSLKKYHEFKDGYFAEKWVKFCGKNIRLINIHISRTYEIQLKLSLIEYLSRLQNKYTIIMGDFNAAKKEQTEVVISGNDRFLRRIESKGYVELLDEKEKNGEAHYTHYVKKEGKKLDHVFVSKAFNEDFKTNIEYDDDVNYTVPEEDKSENSKEKFTDHSAITVTIEKKPKED